jgi:hypothetical protein
VVAFSVQHGFMTKGVPTRVALLIVAGAALLVVGGAALTARFTSEGTAQRAEGARTKFREYGVDSYTVDVERSCYCDTNGLTFTVTVEHGKLTHVSVRGFMQRDTRRTQVTEWDAPYLPRRYEWLRDWGPIDRALSSVTETVERGGVDGPAAMFFDEGEHKLVTELSVDTSTGILRSYSADITNTSDAWVDYRWSNFRQID